MTATACTHPVRLRGRIAAVDLATGELRTMFDTDDEPDGELLVLCGNRREAVCPSCSGVYKRDARQLVKAGLAGGKGIPGSIAAHPCVFATFTAPSFGPVHARRMRGQRVLPCRPRRDTAVRVCPHGRDISCPRRHHPDDPALGRALCPDCYDYQAAVLFNAHAGKLWKRFTTYLPRHLARLSGLTQKQLRALVRVRYVKVAEYQARGVVHYHAVIRLDAPGEDYQPPPARFTADLLREAIVQAANAVTLPVDPGPHAPPLRLRFGHQIDVKPIRLAGELPGTGWDLSVQAVGNYIAKYATKTLDTPGLPPRRITNRLELDTLRCAAHYRRMVLAAWELGGGQLTPGLHPSPLTRWAHQLGHGGHFLTKSCRYSVTFGQLRQARADHRRAARHPDGERDPWGRPLDDRIVLVISAWTYAGPGPDRTHGAELALTSADMARSYS